jgi:hypothetical protein
MPNPTYMAVPSTGILGRLLYSHSCKRGCAQCSMGFYSFAVLLSVECAYHDANGHKFLTDIDACSSLNDGWNHKPPSFCRREPTSLPRSCSTGLKAPIRGSCTSAGSGSITGSIPPVPFEIHLSCSLIVVLITAADFHRQGWPKLAAMPVQSKPIRRSASHHPATSSRRITPD